MRASILAPAALALTLALASPALAGAGCHAEDRDQWARDAAAVTAAQDSFRANGYDGIRGELRNLETVVSHSPADAAEVTACGLSAEQWASSPYPTAAMMLGSARIEFGWGPEAEEALRRGLLMDPANATLAAEAGTAMMMQHQPQEAVDVTTPPLASGAQISDAERARLLRVRGVALIDLQRLDEAEAAFRESLRYDPNNRIATGELQYIDELRAGGPQRESGGVVQSRPGDAVPPQPGT